MKNLMTWLTVILIGVATFNHANAASSQDSTKKTKSGKLDRRYNANKHLKSWYNGYEVQIQHKVAAKAEKDTIKMYQMKKKYPKLSKSYNEMLVDAEHTNNSYAKRNSYSTKSN